MPRTKVPFSVIYLGGAAVLLLSCAAPPNVVRQSSDSERPSWIMQPPEDGKNLFFVGFCTGADSLEAGEEAAAEDAASKIAKYVYSEVRADYSEISTELGQKLSRQIKSKSTAALTDFKILQLYYESAVRTGKSFSIRKYDVYVLVSYSRQAAESERERQEQERKSSLAMAIKDWRSARQAEKRHEYIKALQFYKDSLHLLETAQDSTPIDMPETGTCGALRRQVGEKIWEADSALRKVDLKIKTNGSKTALLAFRSALLSKLSEKGFSYDPKAPAISLKAELQLLRGGIILGNLAYSAEGSVRASMLSSQATVMTLPIHGKGFNRKPSLAQVNASAEAGEAAGTELAGALEKLVRSQVGEEP